MRTQLCSRAARTAGFTLIETTVALTIFVALGYALSVVVAIGKHSQSTISGLTTEDRSLREATTDLVEDLRNSSDSTIAVSVLPDGNHQVQLMEPIDLGGVASWGVYDRTVNPNPMPNWQIVYTVIDQPIGNGAVDRQLVREILDDTGVMKKQTVLADRLSLGTQVPPGFQMIKTGAVWQITLSTQGKVEGKSGIREVFHVQTRN
jgi:hypothetical protein